MHDLNSPMSGMLPHHSMALQEQHLHMLNNTYKRELKIQFQVPGHHVLNTIPPELESPSFHSLLVSSDHQTNNVHHAHQHVQLIENAVDQVTDWRVLDKFVASQLSHDATKGVDYTDEGDILQVNEKQEVATDYASTSTSSSQVDPWK
uniref:NAC037 n=1 Tax=Arundo donax TaxID=35708 RepID=A0A0A9CNQ6_ARUDO